MQWHRLGFARRKCSCHLAGQTVLVWGRLTATGLTRLHIVPHHTSINSEYYVNNILKKELKPVYDRLDTSGTISKWQLFTNNAISVFQQDGARAHTSAVSRAWLNKNIPNYNENWPPNSPDLSPIKNLWSILSRSVYKDPEPKISWSAKMSFVKSEYCSINGIAWIKNFMCSPFNS